MSRPGVFPSEIGIGPSMLLSARSSQYSLDRLPMAGGIRPVKRLEFRDLHLYEKELTIARTYITSVHE